MTIASPFLRSTFADRTPATSVSADRTEETQEFQVIPDTKSTHDETPSGSVFELLAAVVAVTELLFFVASTSGEHSAHPMTKIAVDADKLKMILDAMNFPLK